MLDASRGETAGRGRGQAGAQLSARCPGAPDRSRRSHAAPGQPCIGLHVPEASDRPGRRGVPTAAQRLPTYSRRGSAEDVDLEHGLVVTAHEAAV
ncbi:hypothetical protein [Kribbella sp. NPDC004536]|uniref:hypothetical protein n=1 Tax=Kribbella sp. NPDC004536 TaxID=3364106 RepID=UPI003674445D